MYLKEFKEPCRKATLSFDPDPPNSDTELEELERQTHSTVFLNPLSHYQMPLQVGKGKGMLENPPTSLIQ